MTGLMETLILLIEPTALAVMLVYAYSLINRSVRATLSVNLVMGLIFGLATIVAMSSPIFIADGVVIDIRNLFVGVASAYFGFAGGLLALLIGCLARFSIGGTGMMLGFAGMIAAFVMGQLWSKYVQPRISDDQKSAAILSAMISTYVLLGAFLPEPLRTTFFYEAAPTLIVANFAGCFILCNLITREQRLLRETNELVNAARLDPLTKLHNRNSAVAAYNALTDPPAIGVAMLCIDVDKFKTINDTHGHLAGDGVLVNIAKRVASCLRSHDIFARMSGDEFLVVLHDLTNQQARAVAERCRKSVQDAPIVCDGKVVEASISIGLAWSRDLPGFETLRAQADGALYEAKEQGRDRVGEWLMQMA